MMMMMMMNCFCGMVDRWKAFSLISSRHHCQRSSPSRISNTPRAGFEPAQNLSSGLVEWSCAVVITTAPQRHYLFYPCFFFTWSVCFCNIEFFRDIFAGNPPFNFHQCCIFQVQCMLHLTSFFLQYSPFLQKHSNNYVCTECNSVKTKWALRTCAVMISLLTFLKHIES